MIKKVLSAAALMALAFGAKADIIHVVEVNQTVGLLGTVSYAHNLKDETDFVLGSAAAATIEIGISSKGILPAVLVVVIENFDFDSGGFTFGKFFNDIEVKGLAALNSSGVLNVTIQSALGGFKVGTSTLTVATVPEPATLALLGGGLLAFGLGRRRRNLAA